MREQLSNLDAQPLGQLVEHIEGRIPYPALNPTHIGTVKAHMVREVLLRPPFTDAKLTYALTKRTTMVRNSLRHMTTVSV